MKTKKTSALLFSVFLGVLLLGSSAVNTAMAQDEGPPLPLKGDVTIDFNFGFDSTWTNGPTPQNLDPNGHIGKTYWYNVTSFDTPLDDLLTGTPLGGGPMGIDADFEGSEVGAKILRQDGPVYDFELLFVLGNDIVLSLDTSQANMPFSIPSLSDFTIPGGILVPLPIAVTSFGNWSEFDDLMDSPMGDKGMGPVLPGTVILDGDSWDDNYDLMSNSLDELLNNTIGSGVTVTTNLNMNNSGLFLDLSATGFDERNTEVNLEIHSEWLNDSITNDGILDYFTFYLDGDFDENGWVSTSEYIDFELTRDESLEVAPVGLPISTGNSGSLTMAAGLDILLSGDLASITDQMGISNQIGQLENLVNELDGMKFAEFTIGGMDGLFYEMHGEATDIFYKLKDLFGPGPDGGGAGDDQFGYPKHHFSTVVNGYDGMKYKNTTEDKFWDDKTHVRNGYDNNPTRCNNDGYNQNDCAFSIRADGYGIVQIEPRGRVVSIEAYDEEDFDMQKWEQGQPQPNSPLIPLDWWYAEVEHTWTDEYGYEHSDTVEDLFIEFNTTSLLYETYPGWDSGSWTEPMILIFNVQRIPGYKSYQSELEMMGKMDGGSDDCKDCQLASSGSLPSMVQIPGMPEIPGPDPMYIFGTFLVPAPAITPEWRFEESIAALGDAILDKAVSLLNELYSDPTLISQLEQQGVKINNFNLTGDLTWESTTNDAGAAAYELWSEVNFTAGVSVSMPMGDPSSSQGGSSVDGDLEVEFYLASSEIWLQSGVFDSSYTEGSVYLYVDVWEVGGAETNTTTTTTTSDQDGPGGFSPGFEFIAGLLVLATVPAVRALRRRQ